MSSDKRRKKNNIINSLNIYYSVIYNVYYYNIDIVI